MTRWLRIMDRAGVGIGVNLSGGTVTAKPGLTGTFHTPDRFGWLEFVE